MLLMDFLGPEGRLDSWGLLCMILSQFMAHEAFQTQEKKSFGVASKNIYMVKTKILSVQRMINVFGAASCPSTSFLHGKARQA